MDIEQDKEMGEDGTQEEDDGNKNGTEEQGNKGKKAKMKQKQTQGVGGTNKVDVTRLTQQTCKTNRLLDHPEKRFSLKKI